MCGIIGKANKKSATQAELIFGLNQMEYRGYDSAGIIFSKNFETFKSIGSLINLKNAISHITDTIGIAHTRWATHGEVSLTNTHPIKIGKYAIVHNGIIENTNEILSITKYKPYTQTDTEILLAYFTYLIKNHSLEDSLKFVNENIKGSFAAAILEYNSSAIIWMKKGFSPLILAETDTGNIIVSDIEGIMSPTKIYEITSDGYGYINCDDIKILHGEYKEILPELSKTNTAKNQYATWLEKEIYEQITIYDREESVILKKDFSKYSNIKLIGCGSSFFAAELGSIWLEEINAISSASIASEWSISKTSNQANQLAIFISQSGFTADTLAALLKAKPIYDTIALVNHLNSPISSNSNESIYLHAGQEKSVASSKSFSTQIIKLYQMIFGSLPINISEKIKNIFQINIDKIAEILSAAETIFILGKSKMNIVAKEGMLKITEITYLNVFSYPAGELKHGYISKITENTYTIILAPEDPILLNKTISSAQEVLTRKGKVIWISSKNHINTDYFIETQSMNYDEATFCYTILLQRLALKIAENLKREVDKPRNLAKSVTVE